MTLTRDEEVVFDELPTFDARKFEPPAWANDPLFRRGSKNGESSKTATNGYQHNRHMDKEDNEDEDEDDDEDDVFEDALSDADPEEVGLGAEPQIGIEYLRALLSTANELKAEGNAHFTAKPPRYTDAMQSYEQAKFNLPILSRKEKKQPEPTTSNVIEEITEEEAAEIEAEGEEVDEEERERENLEEEIRECRKACLGNLAASLEIDPNYIKGLHRRATASERITTLTSLNTAKDDYTKLISLLPSNSPLIPVIRRSLLTLPGRIKDEEKKQYDEMMGKLKELGNSFLGNFGLSTDSFKFDQQPGGGYSMQFNR
ncbi:hypothetical protein IAR55_006259 [Kwoniella newhampshirensis]|uniref:Tetratricopeptide repeat protein 1 n=1 Tax=Kwoniella newhampshirensis TaxID=1651941 RepID=A0AAW0YK66_9TREE